jgi:hypothetical protein
LTTTTSSSSGCGYAGDCTCQLPPPPGLGDAVRCEAGEWVVIGGSNIGTNQTVVVPQNTTVVRFLPVFHSVNVCVSTCLCTVLLKERDLKRDCRW